MRFGARQGIVAPVKLRPRALGTLGVLLALCGCSLGDAGAERWAKEKAELLGRQMTIRPVRDYTALDLVRRVEDEQDVTFLRADGAPIDGNAVIVARIYAEYEGAG